MRAAGLVLLTAGLLAGCVPEYGSPSSSVSPGTCTTGYSSESVIHLSVSDHDRSITTHLCYAIDVLLIGPPAIQWQTVQSSNEAILAILPLPLPAPPPGGTHEVYLAKRTGSASLSSVGLAADCPIGGKCPANHWTVTVTVVT
jgi:hypothetical protein